MPELTQIRRDGIAFSVNAASPGAAVIAALVPASEQDLPMAIGVGGPVDHIVPHRDMIANALRRALQLA
jgi:DNA-binding IclR family transcriptional regulator